LILGAANAKVVVPCCTNEKIYVCVHGSEVSVDTKKLVTAAVVIFLLFFVVTQPTQAADITHTLWHGTVNVAHGVASFVGQL
jgi:hypothetical protein